VLTVDQIVTKGASKRMLAKRFGPEEIACVDMESAALSEVCREYQLPLLLIRCVTDVMDEDLPLDFNRCVRKDGTLSVVRTIKAVLRKPGSVSKLFDLRRRSDMCARHMAVLVRKIAPLLRDHLEANTGSH
jgi:adenosylhomocysteine nucleosidase